MCRSSLQLQPAHGEPLKPSKPRDAITCSSQSVCKQVRCAGTGQAGWQAELTRVGDRPIEGLCGSRNRLTGLGLSGVPVCVCVCRRPTGLLTVYVCIIVHNITYIIKYVQKIYARTHVCTAQAGLSFVCTAVKQALVWPGFEVPAALGFRPSYLAADASARGGLVSRLRLVSRRSSRLSTTFCPLSRHAAVSTTDGPAMVSRGGRVSYCVRGPRGQLELWQS